MKTERTCRSCRGYRQQGAPYHWTIECAVFPVASRAADRADSTPTNASCTRTGSETVLVRHNIRCDSTDRCLDAVRDVLVGHDDRVSTVKVREVSRSCA